jgi:uncharacterized protein YodC (DUF2158 family)
MSSDDLPFPIGTVVKLKSGGPNMTVAGFQITKPWATHKTVICVYFGNETKFEENFDPATLDEVDGDAQPSVSTLY